MVPLSIFQGCTKPFCTSRKSQKHFLRTKVLLTFGSREYQYYIFAHDCTHNFVKVSVVCAPVLSGPRRAIFAFFKNNIFFTLRSRRGVL